MDQALSLHARFQALLDDTDALYQDVIGTNGNNRLRGTGEADLIEGRGGRDRLFGFGGNDTLDGGRGNDVLRGGGGRDTFIVSEGSDDYYGGGGRDTLDASDFGSGVIANTAGGSFGYPSIAANTIVLADGSTGYIDNIEVFLGSRHDDTFGASGLNPVARGGGGDDFLNAYYASGTIRLFGGAGDDRMEGGDGLNILNGGGGNDRITGHYDGSNRIIGGAGDDVLGVNGTDAVVRGGAGNDHIRWYDSDRDYDVWGGAGADVFDFGYYQSGTIRDFQPGIDQIDLSAHLSHEDTSFAELRGMIENVPGGCALVLDFQTVSNFRFVFLGVSAGEITEHDIVW